MMQRRAYYDAEPWYQREGTQDWYQQMEKTNQAMMALLAEKLNAQSRVLEIACGGGWLAEFILGHGSQSYLGFDYAETAAKNTADRIAKFPSGEAKRGDALHPLIYAGKYNSVVSHQFLHCLIGPDRSVWLANCRSALKDGGIFVISSMAGVPPALMDSIDPATKQNKPGNRYYAEESEIEAEISAAGFGVVQKLQPEPYSVIFLTKAERL